jgi:hypothetical protein
MIKQDLETSNRGAEKPCEIENAHLKTNCIL